MTNSAPSVLFFSFLLFLCAVASAAEPPATGTGPLDPDVMMANHDPDGTWDPMVDHAMMSRNVRAFMSLFHCSKPVVCKVHGFCVAGGTDMALCSDQLMIAADIFRYQLTVRLHADCQRVERN